MTDILNCPACGGPNEPVAGVAQMACTYCGANLTIPASMRRAAPPKVERPPAMAAPPPRIEEAAPDLLRKAEPVVTKAWNAYAYWTWIRRALPACLVVVVIGICTCVILSALPFIMNR